MSLSLATKGVICSATQIIRSDVILATITPDCVDTSISDCLCPVSYKRRNAINLKFSVSRNNEKISSSELENALDITFALKQSIYLTDDESVILKKKSLGEVLVLADDDDLLVPNLLIPLSSLDMNIDAGSYFSALCLCFSSEDKYEADLYSRGCEFNSVYISQDILSC